MNKKILLLVGVLVLLGVGFYLYNRNQAMAPVVEDSSLENLKQEGLSENSVESTVSPTTTPAQNTPKTAEKPADSGLITGRFSAGEDLEAPDIQVVEVGYDGSKFNPATVDIKVNDWIFFKNNSKSDFWPASGPHPSHTNYPEFDSKKALGPGQTFKFQFTKAGSWKFHDHLNPTAFGTIQVK